ncbi:MAG TPA: hypothetical protein VE092_10485 [Herbaspirillum sp.]|uniref:hypothetical protein n=1 Tax=Herbaspirillum sp. TaxID=1890675 RepID=UPI002D508F1F|nr:hypothetical protein [Herbaspirillum sp.]HZG20432.1 hypothetical protein [Herbaspirillum sp.]
MTIERKPSTLAQQIQHARIAFESWTPSRQATVCLEGADAVFRRSNNGKFLEKETVSAQPKKRA